MGPRTLTKRYEVIVRRDYPPPKRGEVLYRRPGSSRSVPAPHSPEFPGRAVGFLGEIARVRPEDMALGSTQTVYPSSSFPAPTSSSGPTRRTCAISWRTGRRQSSGRQMRADSPPPRSVMLHGPGPSSSRRCSSAFQSGVLHFSDAISAPTLAVQRVVCWRWAGGGPVMSSSAAWRDSSSISARSPSRRRRLVIHSR